MSTRRYSDDNGHFTADTKQRAAAMLSFVAFLVAQDEVAEEVIERAHRELAKVDPRAAIIVQADLDSFAQGVDAAVREVFGGGGA